MSNLINLNAVRGLPNGPRNKSPLPQPRRAEANPTFTLQHNDSLHLQFAGRGRDYKADPGYESPDEKIERIRKEQHQKRWDKGYAKVKENYAENYPKFFRDMFSHKPSKIGKIKDLSVFSDQPTNKDGQPILLNHFEYVELTRLLKELYFTPEGNDLTDEIPRRIKEWASKVMSDGRPPFYG